MEGFVCAESDSSIAAFKFKPYPRSIALDYRPVRKGYMKRVRGD